LLVLLLVAAHLQPRACAPRTASITGTPKTCLAAMPLTMEELKDIRDDCMADDIDIPEEAVSWVRSEAIKFFESGGSCFPRNEGLEGAETLAWYDLQQRQFETTDADTMMDALSRALFKVTGDKEFEKEELEQEPAKQVDTKEHQPEMKYEVQQLREADDDSAY